MALNPLPHPTFHYAGRCMALTAALPGSALIHLLKVKACWAVLLGSSGISLQAAAAMG